MGQSFSANPRKQEQAAAQIESEIRNLVLAREKFKAGYIPDWMGEDDDYAKQMKAKRIFEHVLAAFDAVIDAIEMTWKRALELSHEIQQPQQTAREAIEDYQRATDLTAPDTDVKSEGPKRHG